MSQEPFHVLIELFSFVSASQLKLLNVISSKLDGTGTDVPDLNPIAISEAQFKFLHYRRVLEEQSHKISEVLVFIKNREALQWPQGHEDKSNNAAARAEQGFEYLLDRSVTLQKRCDRELATIMNNANIAEARNGIVLSRRVLRLSVLVAGYVPLSFSTSIFGMSFLQFEDEAKGFWVSTIVAILIFLFSFIMFLWDNGTAAQTAKKIRQLYRMIAG